MKDCVHYLYQTPSRAIQIAQITSNQLIWYVACESTAMNNIVGFTVKNWVHYLVRFMAHSVPNTFKSNENSTNYKQWTNLVCGMWEYSNEQICRICSEELRALFGPVCGPQCTKPIQEQWKFHKLQAMNRFGMWHVLLTKRCHNWRIWWAINLTFGSIPLSLRNIRFVCTCLESR